MLAPKGATLKSIKSVESHVMALGQCHKFIRKHNLQPVVTADTAKSAHDVAKSRNKARAAIASPLAGKIYGLKVLAPDVQDVAYNTTRFIVLSRERQWAPHGKGPTVTTLMFQVRNIPGALYKALGGFATSRVNITKLESYMEYGSFLATQFYADVEGHPDDAEMGHALEELKFFSKELQDIRCLSGGSVPRHVFREDAVTGGEMSVGRTRRPRRSRTNAGWGEEGSARWQAKTEKCGECCS